MGGLGNQLFQYTFCKYCEKKSGNITLLHTEYFKNITTRKFMLDRLMCDYVGIRGSIICEGIVEEAEFTDIGQGLNEIFFRGYWQNKKFFEEVKEDILSEVRIRDEYLSKELIDAGREIQTDNSVAIHFRRGDYLHEININTFYSLPVSYYKMAIEEIGKRCGGNLKAYIFTEDADYVSGIMDQLGEIDIKIMPVRENYEDMYLMSLAKHHIIANSTFSWWGAALSKENGITIIPKNWFLDRPSPDLCLDNWIMM
jgi:hypothetical protein